MTQVRKCRYKKLMVVGALITTTFMFTGFNGMTEAEVNLTDGKLYDKTSGSEEFMRKASPEFGTIPSKRKLTVHMSNDNAMVTKTNGYHKSVEKDQFVALDGTENIKGGEMIEVPADHQKDFHIEIKGLNRDGLVKIYRHPDLKDEVVQSFKIPSTIRLDELAIYNGRFFRIHDAEGKDWYVDANSIDYRIVTNTTLRRVGNIVTDKVRNVQLNLTERTNLTAYELKSITAGTNLEGIEDAVVEIEETYGVNALFTLSVAALESGWGNSYLARNRNNLFGICAYDNNVDAASSFASKSECVRYWGKLIANEYFAHGRTTAYSINAIYASNQSWADEVLDGMRRMANKI